MSVTTVDSPVIGTSLAGLTLIARNVSWERYLAVVDQLGDSPSPRVAFVDGSLELMSPGQAHERLLRAVDGMIRALSRVWQIRIVHRGSATYRKDEAQRGSEPDGSYFVHRAAQAAGHTGPATRGPDPVVEIDISKIASIRK